MKEDKLKSSVLGEIPLDDASPVTCSTAFLGCVQGLPDVKMSFNLKLAVLLFCYFSIWPLCKCRFILCPQGEILR